MKWAEESWAMARALGWVAGSANDYQLVKSRVFSQAAHSVVICIVSSLLRRISWCWFLRLEEERKKWVLMKSAEGRTRRGGRRRKEHRRPSIVLLWRLGDFFKKKGPQDVKGIRL